MDYALFEHEDGYVVLEQCGCGSPTCRHKFTGSDWKKSEVRDAYATHFSPLINKKIAGRRPLRSRHSTA